MYVYIYIYIYMLTMRINTLEEACNAGPIVEVR